MHLHNYLGKSHEIVKAYKQKRNQLRIDKEVCTKCVLVCSKEELLGANLNLGQGSSMKIDNRRCQLLMRISRGDRGCRGRQRLRLPPGVGLEKNVVVPGLSELRWAGGPCPPPTDFGRSVNPISTRMADYANYTLLFVSPPHDFQTFLRP